MFTRNIQEAHVRIYDPHILCRVVQRACLIDRLGKRMQARILLLEAHSLPCV